jgi:hypothetical protein
MVETAFVATVLFFSTIGLVVWGLGGFRYQEVAWLAHEGARYASVHAAKYQSDGNGTSPSEADIKTYLQQNFGVGLQSSRLTVTVQFVDGNTGALSGWDGSTKAPLIAPDYHLSNRVRVTVTYNWFPEFYIAGPIALSSKAEVPICY